MGGGPAFRSLRHCFCSCSGISTSRKQLIIQRENVPRRFQPPAIQLVTEFRHVLQQLCDLGFVRIAGKLICRRLQLFRFGLEVRDRDTEDFQELTSLIHSTPSFTMRLTRDLIGSRAAATAAATFPAAPSVPTHFNSGFDNRLEQDFGLPIAAQLLSDRLHCC